MKKILITGPESSGKSYLTFKLAEEFDSLVVQEYAREYLSKRKSYDQTDLIQIAIGQNNAESGVWNEAHDFLFADTGIEVICIWSKEKYGNVPSEIRNLLNLNRYDLILLCKPNIPWEFDVLREHPIDRERLFDNYESFLKKEKVSYRIIDASLLQRFDQAKSFVQALTL